MRSAPTLLVAVLLVGALLTAGAVGAGAQEQSDCSEVTHDAFRLTNSTIAEVEETGSATASIRNVPVTVEDTEQFVRIRMNNPNGYCVQLRVQISERVVTPAELGTVDAVEPEGSDIEAKWSAKHSLSEDERYTEVAVQLPAGADGVLFAPSKLRVQTLSWTGEAEGKAKGAFGSVKSLFGEKPDLEENTYHLQGEKGQVVTVDLTADDGREVEKWQATYEDSDGTERPVGQDSSAPVFYSSDSESVRFHYNQGANVSFTANPSWTDRRKYDIASYRASVGELLDIQLPFTVAPLGGVSP